MRRILSGAIEYPHFEQSVLSEALTFSRLIFCFEDILTLACYCSRDPYTADFRSPCTGLLPYTAGCSPEGLEPQRGYAIAVLVSPPAAGLNAAKENYRAW